MTSSRQHKGANLCNSARDMMMVLGCIQSLECNKNTCPTGVATQNPASYEGLNVADKRQRVANSHKNTVEAVVELIAAAGLTSTNQLDRCDIQRRVSAEQVRCYDEIYPSLEPGCLLQEPYPKQFEKLLQIAHAGKF